MQSTDMSATEITDRKRQANQQNARRSTGPRTPQGKSACSQNAMKYGLFAGDHVILPSESQADHDAIEQDFIESIRPTDAAELAFVERMINARWKLRRLKDAESHRFENDARRLAHTRARAYLAAYDVKGLRQRQIEQVKDEAIARAKVEWVHVKTGHLIAEHLDYNEDLAKQEQRLENAFYKALRELRTWRHEKRASAKAPADTSADVGVACGFADQAEPEVETTDAAPSESPISQNEPTASATAAPIEACEIAEATIRSDSPKEVINRLPANVIQPIQLNLPESG